MLPGVTASFDRVAAALADRYRLIRELGSGGMATVYLAEDMRHRRQVAVKVLRPELAATLGADRFTREIETVAQFQHPHILPLLDSGQADGFFYYVMPSVAGESLRDRLARHGELPIHDAVKILVEVVDALAYAHAHGVVHRDIKPDNVLLSGRHALVMDFGVAKALSDASAGSRVTTAGVALGTPAYMAPEQAAADPHIDHRADLYAVGVLGYELVTGGPPFVGKTASEVLAAQVTRRPEPLQARRPACPAALAHIVMKCLEKRPADRWQSADELLAQLEPLATPSGGTTPTATRPMAAVIGTPLRRYVAAAVVLAAVVVGVVLLARPRPPAVALGRRVQVTLDPGLEIDPALSPDGKLLAYTAGSPGRMRLYVRQLEGGTPVPVVRGVGGFQRLPHWAPDGARLLFLSDRGIEIAPALGGAPRHRRPQSQHEPRLDAGGAGAAVRVEPRRRAGCVRRHRGGLGRFGGPAGAAHDGPQCPRDQCGREWRLARLLGVHGDVERLVAADPQPRAAVSRAGAAGDQREPNDRGLRRFAGRSLVGVRLQPERRAAGVSRLARGRGAGAAHQRLDGRVFPRLLARRAGDRIPWLPRGTTAGVRHWGRGRSSDAADARGRGRARRRLGPGWSARRDAAGFCWSRPAARYRDPGFGRSLVRAAERRPDRPAGWRPSPL